MLLANKECSSAMLQERQEATGLAQAAQSKAQQPTVSWHPNYQTPDMCLAWIIAPRGTCVTWQRVDGCGRPSRLYRKQGCPVARHGRRREGRRLPQHRAGRQGLALAQALTRMGPRGAPLPRLTGRRGACQRQRQQQHASSRHAWGREMGASEEWRRKGGDFDLAAWRGYGQVAGSHAWRHDAAQGKRTNCPASKHQAVGTLASLQPGRHRASHKALGAQHCIKQILTEASNTHMPGSSFYPAE